MSLALPDAVSADVCANTVEQAILNVSPNAVIDSVICVPESSSRRRRSTSQTTWVAEVTMSITESVEEATATGTIDNTDAENSAMISDILNDASPEIVTIIEDQTGEEPVVNWVSLR